MHPWMDPPRETVLWPHEYSAVYQRLRPHLRLPRPRLGQPAERAPQPALRRRRGVRPPARRHPRWCCRSCRRWRPARRCSTARSDRRCWTTGWSSTGRTSSGSRRSRGRVIPEPVFTERRLRGHDLRAGCTPTSRRTTPTRSCGTSGSTPAAPSPASTATPSRSGSSTSRNARPPTWPCCTRSCACCGRWSRRSGRRSSARSCSTPTP